MKKITEISLAFILIFLLSMPSISVSAEDTLVDYDPNCDIQLTIDILQIRSFERLTRAPISIDNIDIFSAADFYVTAIIDGETYQSPVWKNMNYVYDDPWSISVDVPDDKEIVNVILQLWDENIGPDTLCDISGQYYGDSNDKRQINLSYSLKSGHWTGDDFISDYYDDDKSGYGRASGCDDGSSYQYDHDCELWFNIYQTDPDGDGIPYWVETEIYDTDPLIDDTGYDPDGDEIPIEWEHHFGQITYKSGWSGSYEYYWIYDPLTYDNHTTIDDDEDALSNYQEYLMWGWGADPGRQDIFLEMDYMETSPEGISCVMSERSKELIRTSFNRRNIILHIDDGDLEDCPGPLPVESGCDELPFTSSPISRRSFENYYNRYFIHHGDDEWREDIFHYGPIVYQADYQGYAWGAYGHMCLQISAALLEEKKVVPKMQWRRDVVYASAYMHEFGHTLGIGSWNTPGCDDQNGRYPWELNYWLWTPYMSCMNYHYTYFLVDYSDGSRGKNDFNDWETIDFSFFK